MSMSDVEQVFISYYFAVAMLQYTIECCTYCL